MLIAKNYTNKKLTKYKCDSCEKEMLSEDRIEIKKDSLKKYDLCNTCWHKIKVLVEKHQLERLKFKKKEV